MKNSYFLLFILYSSILYSQSIYEPINNTDVYDFIERLSQEGYVEFFKDITPVSKLTLAEKLLYVKLKEAELSENELERLSYYLNEFSFEVKYLNKDSLTVSSFFSSGKNDRFNFYKFYSPLFTLTADLILGVNYNFPKKIYHQFTGAQIYGRISDNWGYYFNYRDNLESGINLDRSKSFTPMTGVILAKWSEKEVQYSETRGGISYGWKWGSLTAAKDFIHIGSSSQSLNEGHASVILSDKAPSFPYFRLEIAPTYWFRYDFIHGWLNSNLIDSTTYMPTGVTITGKRESVSYSSLPKYYVGHSISISPSENLWLTLGESIIYGRNIEYMYFLPIFLRLADHYKSKTGADTGDNAQIFFNASYIWQAIASKLYLTLYIDELSPESLFSGGKNAQVYAVTLGGNSLIHY